jgi:Zn-dependent protease with chaperone function
MALAPPPLGPADRRTFDEAQRRHRRATWLPMALCALTVAGMGVAIGGVFVPLIWGVLGYGLAVGLGVFVVVLILPLTLASLVLPFLEPLLDLAHAIVLAPTRLGDAVGWLAPDDPAAQAIAIVGPGVVLAGLAWLPIYRLFGRAGTGGAVLALGARPPRPGDLEEQQLVNLVGEMAIAAGIAPPRVLLLDGDRANAVAVGRDADDATLVLGRPLLDALDRAATQGVVAHLLGSVTNGDLRIAFATVSVFKTFGLLVTVLDAPVSPTARAALGRLRDFARQARDPAAAATEADLVAGLLAEGTRFERLDEVTAGMQRAIDGVRGAGFLHPLRMARMGAMLPYGLANLFVRFVLLLVVGLLLGPLLALAWRARRYLADATAVQLTRYPDGLARALSWLAEHPTPVPGAEWAAHLFAVDPAGTGDAREKTFGRRVGIPFGFHPALRRRLARLRRLGAG